MGRRGQGEMEFSKVSSDAVPALTGRRCVGTVMRRLILSASRVVPQELSFLSLFPFGGTGIFYLQRSYVMTKKLPGKRWQA